MQSLRAPLPNTHVREPHAATPSEISKPPSAEPHTGTPRGRPTSHNTTDVTRPSKKPKFVAAYFRAQYPEEKKIRIETLIRVAKRSLKADLRPHKISVSKSSIAQDHVALAKEVYQMTHKSFLLQKTRIYFLNAIDLAALLTTELSVGRTRKDCALSEISKKLKVETDDVV